MYCTNCGEEVTGNYCSNCGTKIIRKENKPEDEAYNPPVSSDTNLPDTECISANVSTKEKAVYKKAWFWIVIIAYVATVIIVLISVINNYSGSKRSNSGSGYSRSSSTYNSDTLTSSEAIQIAKDTINLDQRIAYEFGFNQFYKPEFGNAEATENEDGSWSVILKGKMSGYVDDYVSDFETMKFEVEVNVLSTGTPLIRNIRRVY